MTRWNCIGRRWKNWLRCDARRDFGKGQKLRRTRSRDRDLHRRPQHQLHKRLQCLLQVLRIYRTKRDEDHYVLSFEQLDQKLDELTAAGGVQILMQGGHHPKLSFQWYIDLLQHIRQKYPHINISRVQSAGVFNISRRHSGCRCEK